MSDPTRTFLFTEERGEPSIITVRKGDRIQLLILDKKDEPHRTLVYDLSEERALRVGRDLINEVVTASTTAARQF